MSGFLCSMVGATFTVAATGQVLRAKKTITAVGNAQVDTAQSNFGGASALFDGSGDRLEISGDLSQTGDFTYEFWFRAGDTTDNQALMAVGNESTGRENIYLNGANPRLNLYAGADDISSSTNISANTWYHLAVVRSASTVTMYLAGSNVGSYTDSTQFGNANGLYIGDIAGGAISLNGHIDEIRVSNSARYTAAFTPATTPFVNDANTLLLIHANGTDASTFFDDDNGTGRSARGISAIGNAQVDTAQSKFGGSSILLDGTGDFLQLRNLPDLGTNNFTIECWVRPNSISGIYDGIFTFRHEQDFDVLLDGSTKAPGIVLSTGSMHYYAVDGTSGAIATYSSSLATGSWQHIALVRNSSNLSVYINGTSVASVSSTATFNNLGTSSAIGIFDRYIYNGGRLFFNGHIDEFRISSTARYTTTFTPSTTAFVNDANTLLLIHADGTDAATVFLDDNSGVPTTAPTTAVTFDGTNDFYIASSITPSSTTNKFLTIACTFYWDSSGGNLQHLVNMRYGTTDDEAGLSWRMWISGGRIQNIFMGGGGSYYSNVYETAENSLTSGAFNQLVFYSDFNNSANNRIFINGVSKAVTTDGWSSSFGVGWGKTNSKIKIGEREDTLGGDGSDNDFKGRVSQVYIHNITSAPDINKFWYFGSNRPRDLGTNGTATGLAQPLIYHYGNTTTFATNNGTGFNAYTLTANGGVATGDGPNYA